MSAPSAIFRLIASIAVLALGVSFTPITLAQWSSSTCAADRGYSSALNCTANDIEIASVAVNNAVTSCVAGDPVTLDLTATLHINASQRYDVGVFLARDGKAPDVPSGSGGSALCQVYGLPLSPSPFADLDANACGDIVAVTQGQSFQLPLGTITVPCMPGPTGNLVIPSVVTWDTNPAVCNAPPSAWVRPGTTSKCESGITADIPVTVRGKISITKQTTPDQLAGSFAFSATGTGATPSSFSLSDNGTQVIATDPLTGTGSDYTVTEGLLAGFVSTAQIACQDSKGQPQTAFVTKDEANRSVTLHMAASAANGLSEVYCTFTNTQANDGSIVIEKKTSGGDGTFSFANTNGVTGSQTNPATFDITTSGAGHRGTQQLTNLATGTYTITETVPSGWYLEPTVNCVKSVGDPGITQVANGVTIVLNRTNGVVDGVACTFNDVKRGSITIAKSASPKDPHVFTFSTTSNPATTALPPSFNLADSGTPPNSIAFTDLLPGVYTVTEAAASNWVLANLVCSGGSNVVTNAAAGLATITLAAGENVSCTYSNVKNGTITVTKNAIGGAGGETFTFTGALPGSIASGQMLTGSFGAGTYSVTESVPSGWALSGIACSGSAAVTFTGAAGGTDAFEPGDTTANITITDGQVAACTFTNTGYGSIRIVKETTGGDATFAYSGSKSFQITTSNGIGENTSAFAAVAPGTYTVSETLPAGWAITGLACSNGSSVDIGSASASITVAPGEAVTCTFSNLNRGRLFSASIVIVKRISGDDPTTVTFAVPQALDASGSFTLSPTIGAGQLGEASRAFMELPAGTYSVSELAPLAGWVSAGVSCTDPTGDTVVDAASRSATIQLALGENVVCTFDNVSLSTITVNVVSYGGTGYFGFSMPGLGPDYLEATISDSVPAGRTFYSLPPGSYGITGTGGGGMWRLTGIQCVAEDGGHSYWTVGGPSVTVVLPHGEDVTCTFYYRLGPAGAVGGGPEEIPTLSEWGMIVMATLLAFTAVVMLRRREAALRAGGR